MKIQVQRNFEPCDIEITDSNGNTVDTVRVNIDLSDSTVNANAAAIVKIQTQCEALNVMKDQINGPTSREADKLAHEMAKLIGPVIKKFIGDESYTAVLAACGDGEPVKPHEANLIMTQIYAAITVLVAERLKNVKNSTAAHYLQEVVDAQREPDTE